MKLMMTLLVRDEEDIIAENLAYHFSVGVDFVLATDNGSRDGTTAILKAYERAGKLEYFYQPPANFAQHAWVTQMARRAATIHGADWVINNDADEFFVPAHVSLKEALAQAPSTTDVLLVPRRDFVPCARPHRQPPPVEMIYCRPEPRPPKAIHRGDAEVHVAQGNHEAASPHFQAPPVDFPEILVYHYPIRSMAQFETKVWNGGSGYDLNDYLHPELGHHKRRWYRLLLAGQLEKEYAHHFFDHRRLRAALETGEIKADFTLHNALLNLSTPAPTARQA